jgi:autotransporter-associated beta strand protein
MALARVVRWVWVWAGVIALAVAGAAPAQTLYWDLNGATPGLGGAGPASWTITAGNTNWSTNPAGNVPTIDWTNGNNAVFDGTAGRVILASDITAPTTTFNVTGYQLETVTTTFRLTGSISLAANVGLTIAPNFGGGARDTIEIAGSVTPAASNNGSSLTLLGSQTASNDARINLLGASPVVSVPSITVTGSGTGVIGFNAGSTVTGVNATVSSNVVNNSTLRFMLGATQNNTLTFSGQISGSGGVFFASGSSGGAGIVTLTNTSSYTGATTINDATSGVVRLGTNNALSPASALQFGVGSNTTGTLDFAGFNQTVASLAVTGTASVNGIANTGGTTSTLTINNTAGTTTTYSSIIGIPVNVTNLSGANNNIALTLASTNTGTQVLTGANTYTGATTINGGTLRLTGSGSIANSATITVGTGATFDVAGITAFSLASGQRLQGNGTMAGAMMGTVTVASGSTVAPGVGAAIGQLAIGATGATTTIAGGGKFEVEIAGNNDSNTDRDQLAVTGALDLRTDNGGATIVVKQLAGSFDASMTHTYTIATTTDGVLVQGSGSNPFTGVNLDTSSFSSPGTFSLSRSGVNLILTFTPVPEPAAALAVFAAGAAVFARRRRRGNRA